METLGESNNRLADIVNFFKRNGLKARECFINFFRIKSNENVGIYISDDYAYFVSMCYDNDWHILSAAKKSVDFQNYLEESADWVLEKIKETELKNPIVTLCAPNRVLFLKEIEFENLPAENISEAIYWDYVQTAFTRGEDFNIAYYRNENGSFLAAGLETKNQKRIDGVYENREIFISNWTTLPEQIKLEVNNGYISLFDVNIDVSNCPDENKINEDYTPAVYAAMVGANLFQGEKKITFPPLRKVEILNWKFLSVFIFILSIIIFSCLFLFDAFKLYSLEKDLYNANVELKNLSPYKTKVQIYSDIVKDTSLKEEFIIKKSKNRMPFQAILLHLGAFTKEGVILKSVKSADNQIIIEGEALSEEYLEEFLNNITEADDIFIKSPKSLKVEVKERINFSFSIDL